MGLRPTYMDETHLGSMSFDGVAHHSTATQTKPSNIDIKSLN